MICQEKYIHVTVFDDTNTETWIKSVWQIIQYYFFTCHARNLHWPVTWW